MGERTAGGSDKERARLTLYTPPSLRTRRRQEREARYAIVTTTEVKRAERDERGGKEPRE